MRHKVDTLERRTNDAYSVQDTLEQETASLNQRSDDLARSNSDADTKLRQLSDLVDQLRQQVNVFNQQKPCSCDVLSQQLLAEERARQSSCDALSAQTMELHRLNSATIMHQQCTEEALRCLSEFRKQQTHANASQDQRTDEALRCLGEVKAQLLHASTSLDQRTEDNSRELLKQALGLQSLSDAAHQFQQRSEDRHCRELQELRKTVEELRRSSEHKATQLSEAAATQEARLNDALKLLDERNSAEQARIIIEELCSSHDKTCSSLKQLEVDFKLMAENIDAAVQKLQHDAREAADTQCKFASDLDVAKDTLNHEIETLAHRTAEEIKAVSDATQKQCTTVDTASSPTRFLPEFENCAAPKRRKAVPKARPAPRIKTRSKSVVEVDERSSEESDAVASPLHCTTHAEAGCCPGVTSCRSEMDDLRRDIDAAMQMLNILDAFARETHAVAMQKLDNLDNFARETHPHVFNLTDCVEKLEQRCSDLGDSMHVHSITIEELQGELTSSSGQYSRLSTELEQRCLALDASAQAHRSAIAELLNQAKTDSEARLKDLQTHGQPRPNRRRARKAPTHKHSPATQQRSGPPAHYEELKQESGGDYQVFKTLSDQKYPSETIALRTYFLKEWERRITYIPPRRSTRVSASQRPRDSEALASQRSRDSEAQASQQSRSDSEAGQVQHSDAPVSLNVAEHQPGHGSAPQQPRGSSNPVRPPNSDAPASHLHANPKEKSERRTTLKQGEPSTRARATPGS
jgi:hypothetical protein